MKFENKNDFNLEEFAMPSETCLELRRGQMPPLILDIRSQDEFGAGHIAGAVSLPAEFVEANLMQLPPFAKIILYGSDSDEKTGESVQLLKGNGFKDMAYIAGGYQVLLDSIKASEDEVFLADLDKTEWPQTIETVLDQKVRPALASDGGGLSVEKIEEDKLYIKYQGACSGCASSSAGTLKFIQNALRVNLNHDIEVISA